MTDYRDKDSQQLNDDKFSCRKGHEKINDILLEINEINTNCNLKEKYFWILDLFHCKIIQGSESYIKSK